MALWDRGAQSRCLVRASAPLPQARHPPANPTGAAPARPLSLLPCRATPAAPGRPLLPPSPHQLLAAAQILPHPPLSITPSALRAEPRPFPALRGLQAAALPSLCASSWPQVPAPSAAPVLLRHLKCPCLSAFARAASYLARSCPRLYPNLVRSRLQYTDQNLCSINTWRDVQGLTVR